MTRSPCLLRELTFFLPVRSTNNLLGIDSAVVNFVASVSAEVVYLVCPQKRYQRLEPAIQILKFDSKTAAIR